jgi:hypothetical protein
MVVDWTSEDLAKIAGSDDLHIAPFREDGTTYGTLTWIWSVVVDDRLYVRGYHGQTSRTSRWYQAAVRQKAGRITAAGMTKSVSLAPIDAPVNDLIDAAYREKYAASPYLAAMVNARARAATIKISPKAA